MPWTVRIPPIPRPIFSAEKDFNSLFPWQFICIYKYTPHTCFLTPAEKFNFTAIKILDIINVLCYNNYITETRIRRKPFFLILSERPSYGGPF